LKVAGGVGAAVLTAFAVHQIASSDNPGLAARDYGLALGGESLKATAVGVPMLYATGSTLGIGAASSVGSLGIVAAVGGYAIGTGINELPERFGGVRISDAMATPLSSFIAESQAISSGAHSLWVDGNYRNEGNLEANLLIRIRLHERLKP